VQTSSLTYFVLWSETSHITAGLAAHALHAAGAAAGAAARPRGPPRHPRPGHVVAAGSTGASCSSLHCSRLSAAARKRPARPHSGVCSAAAPSCGQQRQAVLCCAKRSPGTFVSAPPPQLQPHVQSRRFACQNCEFKTYNQQQGWAFMPTTRWHLSMCHQELA
jgi:hypothetical protein